MQSKPWETGPQSTRNTTTDRLTAGNKHPEPNTAQAEPAPNIAKAINIENPTRNDLSKTDLNSSPSIAQEQQNEKSWDESATSTPRQGVDGSVSSTQDVEHIYPEGGLRAWLVVFGSVSYPSSFFFFSSVWTSMGSRPGIIQPPSSEPSKSPCPKAAILTPTVVRHVRFSWNCQHSRIIRSLPLAQSIGFALPGPDRLDLLHLCFPFLLRRYIHRPSLRRLRTILARSPWKYSRSPGYVPPRSLYRYPSPNRI